MKISNAIVERLKDPKSILVTGLDFSLVALIADDLGTKLQFSRCNLESFVKKSNGMVIELPSDFTVKGNTVYSGFADNLITIAKGLKLSHVFILCPRDPNATGPANAWNAKKADFMKGKMYKAINIVPTIVNYNPNTKLQ